MAGNGEAGTEQSLGARQRWWFYGNLPVRIGIIIKECDFSIKKKCLGENQRLGMK